MVDRELCVQAADRALAYLRERVLDDTWVAAHRDIAYYFKAPQAFLLARRCGHDFGIFALAAARPRRIRRRRRRDGHGRSDGRARVLAPHAARARRRDAARLVDGGRILE